MMAIDISGVRTDYDTLNKTYAQCLFCGAYSECVIMKYSQYFFFLRRKVYFFKEECWFNWYHCRHRATLFEKQDVARYKQEQVETGILSVPYYSNMKLKVEILKPPSLLKIILTVILLLVGIAAFVGFVELVKAILHVPFIP
jgi:hypothetical protein